MKTSHDLGRLEWTLAGWTPYVWRQQRSIEAGVSNNAEVPGIPARVPGSVQGALREADLLPDWNVGLNARLCEWVENRHWIYTAHLPDAWFPHGTTACLRALGLDYAGWILLNGKEIGRCVGSFIPHELNLTLHLREHDNVLQIVFDCPPRWLGQIGYTSAMTEWKPRFNYFWDWTSRLVQTGIWDDLLVEVTDGEESCNMLRVWGGAFLEKEIFYDLCDELGLLVWQEFPLSSSGLENLPPEDPVAIEEMAEIAKSYIERRRHHASLAVWCGGNELQTLDDRPVNETHPMIGRLAEVAAKHDPQHRFLLTSPSGPRFGAEEERFGQGQHWDVHGPWHVTREIETDWRRYWENNDALFHSEVGVAGASSADLIREYKGTLAETPGTTANPLWRRTSWWIDWPVFARERGHEPESLEEFVSWSQERQQRALEIAVSSTKDRFPRCGGILLWMGHDSFPYTANTSLIDFHGCPKPAALALRDIFHRPVSEPVTSTHRKLQGHA